MLTVPKFYQTQGHTFVSVARLRDICTEEPVPPGKNNTIITVGFLNHGRVVDAMHVRRHQKDPDHFVEGRGVADISMHDEGHHYQHFHAR